MRPPTAAALAVALILAAGCGGGAEPEPAEPVEPEATAAPATTRGRPPPTQPPLPPEPAPFVEDTAPPVEDLPVEDLLPVEDAAPVTEDTAPAEDTPDDAAPFVEDELEPAAPEPATEPERSAIAEPAGPEVVEVDAPDDPPPAVEPDPDRPDMAPVVETPPTIPGAEPVVLSAAARLEEMVGECPPDHSAGLCHPLAGPGKTIDPQLGGAGACVWRRPVTADELRIGAQFRRTTANPYPFADPPLQVEARHLDTIAAEFVADGDERLWMPGYSTQIQTETTYEGPDKGLLSDDQVTQWMTVYLDTSAEGARARWWIDAPGECG